MSIFTFWRSNQIGNSELPRIFSMPLSDAEFIKADILQTYTMILTDAMDRVHGISEADEPALWDNCLQSETSVGLISLLAYAMAGKEDLFLVYKEKVLRRATMEEAQKIREDYAKSAKSSVGVFISFKNYRRTEMLKIYSGMEYCVLASLNKLVNTTKAVQIKIDRLRESISLQDADVAAEQGRSIASALGSGRDVLMDAKDLIDSSSPDVEPTDKAIVFLDSKKSFVLGLPLSYVSGAQTPGIGSTGEADMRATERGLKQYWSTILYPVCQAVFGVSTSYKSQDFRQFSSAFEGLKAFSLAGTELISLESQREIIAGMFELDADEEKARIDAEEPERLEKEQAEADAAAEALKARNGDTVPAK